VRRKLGNLVGDMGDFTARQLKPRREVKATRRGQQRTSITSSLSGSVSASALPFKSVIRT